MLCIFDDTGMDDGEYEFNIIAISDELVDSKVPSSKYEMIYEKPKTL